jgi:prevent-host-death family protein
MCSIRSSRRSPHADPSTDSPVWFPKLGVARLNIDAGLQPVHAVRRLAPNPRWRHSLPLSPQLDYMTIVMTGHMEGRAWRMFRVIKASKFKAKCLALIDEVAGTGDPIVITKNGKPLVELVPHRAL